MRVSYDQNAIDSAGEEGLDYDSAMLASSVFCEVFDREAKKILKTWRPEHERGTRRRRGNPEDKKMSKGKRYYFTREHTCDVCGRSLDDPDEMICRRCKRRKRGVDEEVLGYEEEEERTNPCEENPRAMVGPGMHLVVGERLTFSTLGEILDQFPRNRKRAIRAPHNSAPFTGMFGGRHQGEWQLAKDGVLYMEDASDFLPKVLREVAARGAGSKDGPKVIILHVSELGRHEKYRFDKSGITDAIDKTFENQ